jgi:uncharacterized membrane protein
MSTAASERLQEALGGPETIEAIASVLGKSRESVELSLSYMFSGPCPPPAMLKAYDEVIPGLGDRLVRQFESQTVHRQKMERDTFEMERAERREVLAQSRLGLWLGFAVVVVVFVLVGVALALGQPIVGGVLGVADLAVLAGVFVYGSRSGVLGRSPKSANAPGPPEPPKDEPAR